MKDDLLEEARKRFKRCQEAEKDNRDRASEAIKFMALEQWPDKLLNDRERDGRPCLVVDKVNQHIRQIQNDQRQNRPAIKVRPVDDRSDKEVAEMLQGLIRNIEDQSGAEVAYDTAYEHSLSGGFGYWRILTEYDSEDSFNQDIRIKRIPNRFTVYLDPDHIEPDGSDSKFGFIVEDMGKDDYEEQFGKDHPIDWEVDSAEFDDWIDKEKVRIAEYFRIVPETVEIHFLEDGTVHNGELPKGVKAQKTRKAKINKVKWSKINGAEELESSDWLGKYIPIVEVIGNEIWTNGKRRLSGAIEAAMDAQRMHNYSSSAFVEMVALAPKAPWLAANGQIENFEKIWATANTDNVAVLPYNPTSVDGHPVPPPMRMPMQGIPAGWQQVMLNTEHDIQGALGRYQASLGAESNEKSGKAIMARQREGDVGSFHYVDNLARSMRHCGRILIDLIPKVYDTKRVSRILGEDGNTDIVTIDPELEYASGDMIDPKTGKSVGSVFNPNLGKYDVSVTVGPSYTTKRQEAVEAQMQLLQSVPDVFPLIGDIVTRNMDWPGAEQIADRLKAMLPPQVAQLEEQEENDIQQKMQMLQQASQQIEQKAHALFQKEQELMQAQQAIQQAGSATAQERSEVESMSKDLDMQRKLLMEEAKRLKLEAENYQMKAVMAIQSEVEKIEPQEQPQEAGGLQEIQQQLAAIVEGFAALSQKVESMPKSKQFVMQRTPDGIVGEIG